MHTSTRYLAALIALALAGAAPAAQAQGRDPTRAGMPMGDMQGMCTLMSGMHEGPEAALMPAPRWATARLGWAAWAAWATWA